jgi:hypothetical protein
MQIEPTRTQLPEPLAEWGCRALRTRRSGGTCKCSPSCLIRATAQIALRRWLTANDLVVQTAALDGQDPNVHRSHRGSLTSANGSVAATREAKTGRILDGGRPSHGSYLEAATPSRRTSERHLEGSRDTPPWDVKRRLSPAVARIVRTVSAEDTPKIYLLSASEIDVTRSRATCTHKGLDCLPRMAAARAGSKKGRNHEERNPLAACASPLRALRDRLHTRAARVPHIPRNAHRGDSP